MIIIGNIFNIGQDLPQPQFDMLINNKYYPLINNKEQMYQIITILACFIKKFIIALLDKHYNRKLAPTTATPTYQPPTNPEIQALQNRKNEITSTIEEFNNPSTFAKYSKMQREMIKIEKQMQELRGKFEEETKMSRVKFQEELQKGKEQNKRLKSNYVKRSWIMRIIVNFVLIRLVHSYYTYPIPLASQWPLSLFADDQGRLKCSFLMMAGNILFNFDFE